MTLGYANEAWAARSLLIPIGAYAPRWFMKANHVNPEEALQVALDLGSKKLCDALGYLFLDR